MKEIELALEAWELTPKSIRTDKVPKVHHIEATTGERFVLKNIGAPNVLVRTETQFRVTRHVHQSGLPIAYLFETKANSFYCNIHDTVYILMPFLPDDEPDFYNPESGPLYRTLGKAYGRLHAITAEYDGPIKTWEDNAYDPVFKGYVPIALPKLFGETKRQVNALLNEIESHLKLVDSKLPMETVFQDVHRGNVRMLNGEFRGFIDCDHISIGHRIKDITVALISMIKYKGRNGMPSDGDRVKQRRCWLDHFGGFLASYHNVNPLSPLEIEQMPYMMLSYCLPELEEIDNGSASMDLINWFYDHRVTIENQIQKAVAI